MVDRRRLADGHPGDGIGVRVRTAGPLFEFTAPVAPAPGTIAIVDRARETLAVYALS
jgi:hypothetical protein